MIRKPLRKMPQGIEKSVVLGPSSSVKFQGGNDLGPDEYFTVGSRRFGELQGS